jgi:signal transduction histidine kinase
LADKFELNTVLSETANELGKYYLKTGQIDSALKYLNIALTNARTYGQIDQRQMSCEQLLQMAENENNHKMQSLLLRELFEIESQKQVSNVLKNQLEYEVNKSLADKAMMESSSRMQKITIIGISSILFLLMIMFAHIFYSRRKYIKLNSELENKNIEISKQAAELEMNYNKLNNYSNEILQQKEEIQVQRESLEIALNKLKELQKYKDGVAAMIVHDLKNPLNTILNQTKNVLISESASQMLNMVNNILDLQKYEGTSIPLTLKNEKLNNIIENALFDTRYLTESKNLSIKSNISRNFEVLVDSVLIERVFINLLTNAIKYSPLNETIRIEAEPFGKGS